MENNVTCQCTPLSEEEKLQCIADIITDYESKEENLIQILHLAQGIYGYLPVPVQIFIAEKMNLPLSQVSGVISFYTLFTTEKKGDYVIKVCLGTACYVRGGRKIIDRLNNLLNLEVGGITEDGKFSLEITRCIGACGLAPTMMINDKVFVQVNPDKLPQILGNYHSSIAKSLN